MAKFEHINITVSDLDKTADMLCTIFNWKIRWQGPSIHNGRTAHIGDDDEYIAIYAKDTPAPNPMNNYETANGLNHIGILVSDFEETEARIKDYGFETYSHQVYDPGRRFYFRDDDGIEYEVLSYT